MTKTCAMSCSCIDHYYDSYFNSCCNEFRTVIGGWFGLKWCTLISSKKKWLTHYFSFPFSLYFPSAFELKWSFWKWHIPDWDVSNWTRMSVFCRVLKWCIPRNHRKVSAMRFLMCKLWIKGKYPHLRLRADKKHKSVNILYTNFDYSLKLKGMDRAG